MRIAFNGGGAVSTGRAVELTVGQRGVGASLGDGEAVGAVGTGGEGTIAPTAHHLDADSTWRARD